jgi:hypothetical protein
MSKFEHTVLHALMLLLRLAATSGRGPSQAKASQLADAIQKDLLGE